MFRGVHCTRREKILNASLTVHDDLVKHQRIIWAPRDLLGASHKINVHVQGHSWNCAVIPESTGSCRRSVWSTFPPLYSDQSSAGTVRETVYIVGGRAFPVAGPTIWNSLPDNVISAPSLSTFRQRLKHFCSRPRSLTLSSMPGKLFPTSGGS